MELLNIKKSPLQLFSKQLVHLKYVQHIQDDLNKNDVNKLYTKINYLNQSYIFHLIAYWQVFIESLVKDKFENIKLNSCTNPFDNVLNRHIENKLKIFNTPNSNNIDSLLKDTLGINNVTDCWNTDKFNKVQAIKHLNEILDSRHKIAHTWKTSKELNYESNYEDMNFIFELATLLQKSVDEYLVS